jgi:acetyltransferase
MSDDADHAADAAVRIGFPVVVKVDAAAASHKSDVGGVAIDLADAGAVRAAVRGMQARLAGLGPLRFLVQQFVADGQELIVGASRSAAGHMVMFGLGGIHVEVLKDVSFRLGPVSAPEAEAMLASIRGAALLDGVRGRPALCKPALVELIQRVSMLMTQLPEVEELDLNPVLAFADRDCAVDARIRVGAAA